MRSTATWLPSDNGIEVRPGDPSGAAEVEGWLRHYATGRDPHLRARIVLAYLRLPVEEVLEGVDAAMSRNEVSLDQPVGEDEEGCLGDLLATPEPREEPEDLLALAGSIAELPEPERTVIVLRFFQDLDQSAIAARIGCSQMHVSRMLRRALARMRAQLLEP